MLTPKEIKVLELKQKNLTQLQISKKLKISQPAVSKFYNNVLNKIKDAEEVLRLKREMRIKWELNFSFFLH